MNYSKMSDKQRDDMNQIAEAAGKYIGQVIYVTDSSNETFGISRKYEEVVQKLGMNIGSMEGTSPRGIAPNASIAKWGNIDRRDRARLAGFILCDDNREGYEAFVCLYSDR